MSDTNTLPTSKKPGALEFVKELRRCLGQEFSVLDLRDGQLLHESSEQPNGSLGWRQEMVRHWTNRNEVHLQFPGGPLGLLLIPLATVGCEDAAALGVFRLSAAECDDELAHFVQLWHANPQEMKAWLREQPVWTRESLSRVADFALEKLASDFHVKRLNAEVESLAAQVGETFEEISLIYEMTENLRGASSAAELARLVLDWLVEVLPAEQAIVDMHTREHPKADDTFFQSFGEGHLDEESFRHFIDYLQPGSSDIPLVLNEESTKSAEWPFPSIRELVVVPLRTDNRNTGWLAALNHAEGSWFGTTQARLLHAAATILGMRVLFEEVAELREASEAASASKSQFLTNVSHEFRTPLNGIMSFTQMMLEEFRDHDAKHQDSLQTIDACAGRLFELVEDVVEFSQLEAGNVAVDLVPFRLDEVVSGVASALQSRASAKGLRLETIDSESSRGIVISDPARLRQVLNVLVRNAIKFTHTGVIQIRSQVLRGQRHRLRISVRDTGIGISGDKLQTIFDPFVQADGSITRSYSGLGLGLAISKRIARSLGGDLTAESEPGRGSHFILEVDAGAQAELDEMLDLNDEAGPEAASENLQPSTQPLQSLCTA